MGSQAFGRVAHKKDNHMDVQVRACSVRGSQRMQWVREKQGSDHGSSTGMVAQPELHPRTCAHPTVRPCPLQVFSMKKQRDELR
jgi:hypothetical protein